MNLKPSRDDTSRLACTALVGISWATVVANVVINIRNGQRLSIDDTIEFNEFNPEFKAEFSLQDARHDIVRLKATGELDTMNLSKAAFAKRWRVPRSTAWTWLQNFQAGSLIESVPTGTRNVTAIRARINGN